MDAFTVLVVITLVHFNIAIGLWIKGMLKQEFKSFLDKIMELLEQ